MSLSAPLRPCFHGMRNERRPFTSSAAAGGGVDLEDALPSPFPRTARRGRAAEWCRLSCIPDRKETLASKPVQCLACSVALFSYPVNPGLCASRHLPEDYSGSLVVLSIYWPEEMSSLASVSWRSACERHCVMRGRRLWSPSLVMRQ